MATGTGIQLDRRYDYEIAINQSKIITEDFVNSSRELEPDKIMIQCLVRKKGESKGLPDSFPLAEVASGLNGRVITLETNKETKRYLCVPNNEGKLFDVALKDLTFYSPQWDKQKPDISVLINQYKEKAIPEITRVKLTELKAPKLEDELNDIHQLVWQHLQKERAEGRTAHAFRMPISKDGEEPPSYISIQFSSIPFYSLL